jgi:hypothetical protein
MLLQRGTSNLRALTDSRRTKHQPAQSVVSPWLGHLMHRDKNEQLDFYAA